MCHWKESVWLSIKILGSVKDIWLDDEYKYKKCVIMALLQLGGLHIN